MLPSAAHQLQAKLAADLHTLADRRTAPKQGKCLCCTSQHINFQAQDPSGAMPTAATHCIASDTSSVALIAKAAGRKLGTDQNCVASSSLP